MDPVSSPRPISYSRFIVKVATERERLSLDPICSTVYFAVAARKSVVYLFFSAAVVAPPRPLAISFSPSFSRSLYA